MVSVLFLAAHLAVSFLVWRGIQSHMLKVHPYMAAVVLLMPFWGVLLVYQSLPSLSQNLRT